jgi:hypothetical protein
MTGELTGHKRDCDWHTDHYPWECTCGFNKTNDRLSRWQKGFNSGVEEAAKALEADAMKCDCFAREERECGCGAWCEWKSITSARAVEIVRALQQLKQIS